MFIELEDRSQQIYCSEVQDFLPGHSFVDESGRPADTRVKAVSSALFAKDCEVSDSFSMFLFFIIGLRSSDDNSIITGDCLQAIGHDETLLCRQIPKASSDICNLFAFEPFTGDAHVSLVCISIHTGHPHHCVMQVTKVIQVMRDFLSARVLQVEGIKSESTASGRVFRL